MVANTNPPPLRIPILHLDKIVDENGMPTQAEWAYRQALTDSLQNYIGNEGLVMPVQSPTNMLLIQNNQEPDPLPPYAPGQFSCQLGTIIYVKHPTDYAQDKVMIAVRNSNDYPDSAPIFKTVTLT